MKERPIIFSSDMVKAILEGKKTQTRRVMKPQPVFKDKQVELDTVVSFTYQWKGNAKFYCPYGKVGDRLWVRERLHRHIIISADKLKQRYNPEHGITYSVDGVEMLVGERGFPVGWTFGKKRVISSIHMPRWASRITLEITDIRVERLQEIRQEGAFIEGVERMPNFKKKYGMNCRGAFIDLWNSLAKKGFMWNDDPWVWVISFRRLP